MNKGQKMPEKQKKRQSETRKRLRKEGKLIPWNKGTVGICKSNSGSIKKGNVPWNKGISTIPWNKGLKGVQVAWNKGTKGLIKANSGSIKKGQHLSIKTEMKIGQIGERALGYIDGRTHWVPRIRACGKYKLWIKLVFESDDYTCRKCGKRGGRLEAHHIKRFSIIITENNLQSYKDAIRCGELWDIKNGIVLCKKCHTDKHFGEHLKHAKFTCPICGYKFEDYISNREKSKNVYCSRKCNSKSKVKLNTTNVVGGNYGD